MISSKDPNYAVANEVTAGPGGAERSAAQDAGAASIDKVRDILFGTQLREFDRRFARLEERMVKETNDLKEDLRSRLDALEQYARRENESLADQIKTEHSRTLALDEQLSKAQRELRQQMLEQHQRLSDDIRKRAEDLVAALARESRELRNDKADRTTLAALFNEMAMRLTADIAAGNEEAGNG